MWDIRVYAGYTYAYVLLGNVEYILKSDDFKANIRTCLKGALKGLLRNDFNGFSGRPGVPDIFHGNQQMTKGWSLSRTIP